MSAQIISFAEYRNAGTIAERVAKRLSGVAQCVVRFAQATAESQNRRTGCSDDAAVEAGVRCGKQRFDSEPPHGPRAA